MTTEGELDLRQQLEQLKAELAASVTAEQTAIIQQAGEELLASGVVRMARRPGERAPDFTLPNAVGRPYHLADALARGPVVLTFYRGGW